MPALERGIAILRLFGERRRLVSAPEVVAELGLPRSTVHRLLATLVELGLLRRAPGERFGIAPGVLSLGFAALASLDLVQLAEPVLASLRDATDCSAHLAVLEGRASLYLARQVCRSPVQSSITLGSSVPAHRTVMGLVLLAGLDRAALRELYAAEDLAGAPGAGSMGELEALVADARTRGYAVSRGFYERGVLAVAAPVRDASGAVVAGLSISAAQGVVEPEALDGRLRERVVEAAAALSTQLGWAGTAAGSRAA